MKQTLVALLLSLLFISPGVAAETSDEYIFVLRTRSNPYWQPMVDGINETAKAAGIKATVYQTQSDTAAEEQLNICQAALGRKPKFLAISAITSAVGVQCMKQATAQGAQVADMDAGFTPDEAKQAGFTLAFTVGSNNYKIGQDAAAYLAAHAPKPDVKILVLEGAPSSLQGRQRADGFKDKIKTLMPQAVVVASISANWERLQAMSTTTDILQREPTLDVIYAANDVMALGAAEAVRVTGHAPVMIIAVDGTADARKAVEQGRMTATIAQLPYLVGKRAVEKAIDVVNGKPTTLIEVTPTPVLDKKTLTDMDSDAMRYVR